RTRSANVTVALHPDFPDQEVVIGGSLSDKGRTELCSVLKKNLDIFAWQPSDMTGVPRSITEHRLNIREGYTPVRQKKRGQAPERARAIQAEVQKLVDARIMRKVYYHDWLSNLVMGVYCYTKMPFGLKNADATYQRLMDKAFESQVGRNIEVYVDDLVVKSHTEAEMVRDVEETFQTLRKVNMKLNPKKCSFGLAEGVFLGKISAAVPNLKKCIKKSDFRWTAEAEQAFQQLKQHLSELPFLVAPKPREELIMYLSATYGAVSAVLMTERGTTQTSIYFISRVLQGPELNYSPIEKLALLLVFAAKRLRRYFQAHPITVITDQPIKQVNVDSKLVANQVLGTYVEKEENMIKYLEIVKGLVSGFIAFSISQVLVEVLENKSIKEKEVAAVIKENGPTWMTQIADYLKEGVLPGDNNEARKLRLKARQYELKEGVLYRRSFLTSWLRLAKAIRLGYYWPTMHKDARDMIRKCNDCQIHRPVTRHPQQPLTPITAPWPFYKWGIDIAGPFSEGPGKVKFLIVVMDYFTKWVEAKGVATITGGQVKKFAWDNIVCRFGIPGEIISDNGKQFVDNPFKDWCDKLNITQRFASVKHPQSNGLVERANRSLREGIKARLGEGNKNWVEELPHVLWAHRTMIKLSHDDTPFSLTYGTEAVIPAEIGMPTYRTAAVDVVNNDKELRLNLDLLEERRERAVICEAKAKSKMIKYYNARVRDVAFKPGDFVYRSNDASHAVAGGKLGPKWEGPYEVTEALGNGAYKLRSTDGTVLSRTWNVTNLKRCYL
nr:reverse transcriptase domain-containing protein [Tanacetum cinerariifolium]